MFYEKDFLNYLQHERRFAQNTLLAYENDLNQFVRFLREEQEVESIKEAKHIHIRQWIVALMEQTVTSRSINRKLSCLKSYFKYLRKQSHYLDDPLKKVLAPKTGKRLPVFVQEKNMEQLLEDIPFSDSYSDQRNRLILEVLYATGIRRQELIHLRISDLDLPGGYFRITGKGNKQRIVPFAHYLSESLQTYLQLRNEHFPSTTEPFLFLTDKGEPMYPKLVYNIVHKNLSKVTTIEQRSPHVMRHTFATHLSNQGADLNAIKELLGHSSLAATQVYMHNSIEKLKRVYEQAHPKAITDEKEEGVK